METRGPSATMDETHQPLPEARQPLLSRVFTEWRTLAILGGPILIAQVAQMANGVIDTVMAGHASAEDLAAVGIGSSLWMPLFLFFMGRSAPCNRSSPATTARAAAKRSCRPPGRASTWPPAVR